MKGKLSGVSVISTMKVIKVDNGLKISGTLAPLDNKEHLRLIISDEPYQIYEGEVDYDGVILKARATVIFDSDKPEDLFKSHNGNLCISSSLNFIK